MAALLILCDMLMLLLGLLRWLSGKKEMTTHSSIVAWRIPWTEEPGELQSMGSQRVGHDLATKQQQQKLNTEYLDRVT